MSGGGVNMDLDKTDTFIRDYKRLCAYHGVCLAKQGAFNDLTVIPVDNAELLQRIEELRVNSDTLTERRSDAGLFKRLKRIVEKWILFRELTKQLDHLKLKDIIEDYALGNEGFNTTDGAHVFYCSLKIKRVASPEVWIETLKIKKYVDESPVEIKTWKET